MKSILQLFALLSLGQLSAQAHDSLHRHEYAQPKMGTEFRIVLYAERPGLADTAAAEAFQRVEQLEQIFSDYRPDSEVSRLSATAGSGQWVGVSGELWHLLRFSKKVHRRSSCTFDVALGALTKLWRRSFRQQQFPTEADIEAAHQAAGFRYVKMKSGQMVKLTRPGLTLDFGGIAKGYAVDEAMRVLRRHGILSAFVLGGGELLTGEPPPGKKGWTVERLFYQNEAIAKDTLELAGHAISTSGDTYRYLEWEGRRYSHILDPRTGMGITQRRMLSVKAPTCTETDAWATALCVEPAPRLLKRLRRKGWEIWVSEMLVNH